MMRPEHMVTFNSEEELRDWARRLRFFRFIRAGGGIVADSDRFVVALRYDSPEDLADLCERLGMALERAEGERLAAGPVPASEAPPAVIDDTPWYQPGQRTIGGEDVWAWAEKGRLDLTIPAPEWYGMTEAEAEAAARVETVLADLAERVIDPPVDSELCLCPQHYPEMFG